MSIYLYSGTPGSGKSYHATNDVVDALTRGRNVIANFPVDIDSLKRKRKKMGLFQYVSSFDLSVQYLVDFAKQHHKRNMKTQTLLVIDECGMIFNCRQWENKDRQNWIQFFSTHRHLNYDVILISQSDRLIDRQIRAFIETEYKHRAMKNYMFFGKLLSALSGGLFVAVQYWYGPNLRCGSEYFRLNRRRARLYDTMKMFDKEAERNESANKVEVSDTVDKHESGASATAVGASEAAEKDG